jgi:hypothetical protein
MGLDQYLSAKKTFSNSQWGKDEERRIHAEIVSAVDASSILEADHPYVVVEITVAYWRKARAIHDWFLSNCVYANNAGYSFHVTRDELWALHDLCVVIPFGLAVHGDEYADSRIPNPSWFGGGDEKYGDWYKESLKYTADVIFKLLSDGKNENLAFEYSWSE